jgi:hypothetical protein
MGMMSSGIGGVGIAGVSGALIGGGSASVIDADPITPGIQSQPGIVTPVGPPVIVGGPGAIGTSISGALGGTMLNSRMLNSQRIVDADPFTPGIQPALVTTINPNVVGYGSGLYGNKMVQGGAFCCPWWLWVILGLLALGALIGGLYFSNYNSRKSTR